MEVDDFRSGDGLAEDSIADDLLNELVCSQSGSAVGLWLAVIVANGILSRSGRLNQPTANPIHGLESDLDQDFPVDAPSEVNCAAARLAENLVAQGLRRQKSLLSLAGLTSRTRRIAPTFHSLSFPFLSPLFD